MPSAPHCPFLLHLEGGEAGHAAGAWGCLYLLSALPSLPFTFFFTWVDIPACLICFGGKGRFWLVGTPHALHFSSVHQGHGENSPHLISDPQNRLETGKSFMAVCLFQNCFLPFAPPQHSSMPLAAHCLSHCLWPVLSYPIPCIMPCMHAFYLACLLCLLPATFSLPPSIL